VEQNILNCSINLLRVAMETRMLGAHLTTLALNNNYWAAAPAFGMRQICVGQGSMGIHIYIYICVYIYTLYTNMFIYICLEI